MAANNAHAHAPEHDRLSDTIPFTGFVSPSQSLHSATATPPLSPEELGLFARLRPLNSNARNAFKRLKSASDSDIENVYQHHQQFLSQDLEVDRQTQSPDDTDSYVLSLGLLPEFPTIGWRIGRGRKRLRNFGVDLLLPEGDGVAGVHARFCWMKGGGGFFLIADNVRPGVEVYLNGERLRNEQRLIPFQNGISIGECNFTLEFAQRSQDEEEHFQVELAAFYAKVMKENAPLMLPTPSGNEVRLGNWLVRNPIATGGFGRVSIVTHVQTGRAAAAKELWSTPRTSGNIAREVKMAEALKDLKHARIEKLLDETWRPGSSDTTDLYILYSPLSTGTFQALTRSKFSADICTPLFAQVLEGLAFLHENGIAHRDIKPGNLTIRSYDPPDAQIIDFGCATFDNPILYNRYDRPGTIPYLAPEQTEGSLYGRDVDCWAMALVGTEIMGYKRPMVHVTETIHDEIHAWLNERMGTAIANCCKEMLKLNPVDRLTASQALVQHFSGLSNDRVVPKGKRIRKS
ncbi:mitogen activated protein kinase kinase kinase 3 [Phlyctema vagabunda]|uniref:Autophagy-related protein 1 n=1 Tax=Phlyctema vagabunda TaxID=108571 RepID=A0ABR4P618_9HELO